MPRPVPRLAPTYQERVLWQTQADPPELEAHALPATVDVAIVGAGYCGLSAARELARAGRSVVVIERDPLGFGASTRNGGMVIPELKSGPARLEKKYGSVGLRLYEEVNQAFDHVETLIAQEQLDCDYLRSGQLYLAHNRASSSPGGKRRRHPRSDAPFRPDSSRTGQGGAVRHRVQRLRRGPQQLARHPGRRRGERR